jgi:hypothetical protein
MMRQAKLPVVAICAAMWLGGAAHAQVMIDMPAPKPRPPAMPMVVPFPGTPAPPSTAQPPAAPDVGDIALARYAGARQAPDPLLAAPRWRHSAYWHYPYHYDPFLFHCSPFALPIVVKPGVKSVGIHHSFIVKAPCP